MRVKINSDKRRGAVIELVLFIMTVIFLMSALLTSMSVIAHNHKVRAMKTLTQQMEYDAAMESCLAYLSQGGNVSEWKEEKSSYKAEMSETTVTLIKDGKVVLTVELRLVGNTYTIISWEY